VGEGNAVAGAYPAYSAPNAIVHARDGVTVGGDHRRRDQHE
jgi:hypothetical protein